MTAAPSVGCTGRHKNVFYAIGYSGHGVNLTSVFGRIIAELEAGREEPFRWLAAEAGISLYALGESKATR